MINVLVCDDSALMRRSLKKIIESDRQLKVIDAARDGIDAVDKARNLQPDVVTMDINMPGMDGISAMQIIVDEKIAPVIMVSSLTEEGAEATFESLALGAFDYVAKPGGTVSVNLDVAAKEIIAKIKAACGQGTINKLIRHKEGVELKKKVPAKKRIFRRVKPANDGSQPDFIAVAIGISTGGPKTIFEVLPYIPDDLPAAIFLTQHMPAAFTEAYAERIDRASPMKCVHARAGMIVEPGTIYLARGGFHMTLYRKPTGEVVIRTPRKPAHVFMPSVDIMMSSIFSIFGSRSVGVLMTGMGDDGVDAMVDLTEAGCHTIAESEETAIVYGMPQQAILRGGAETVIASWDIAEEIIKIVAAA